MAYEAIPVSLSNEECRRIGYPPMIHWRLASGVVVHSVFTSTEVDITKRQKRVTLKRYIPYGAKFWTALGYKGWRRISEFPWPLGTAATCKKSQYMLNNRSYCDITGTIEDTYLEE